MALHFFGNDSILYISKDGAFSKMRNHSLAMLQKQGVIFLVAGSTVFFLLSDLISRALYMLSLAIGIALIGALIYLERNERKFGRMSLYPPDEDLV